MNSPLVLSCIEWGEFGGLEPTRPEWVKEAPFWEDYTAAFLRSNGLSIEEVGSNVTAWLTSSDRAPFINIVEALLPVVKAKQNLDRTELVMLANWLPDIHLGTSVTNFAIHSLGLKDAFGLGISDRGLSAPLFAIECIDKYLRAPNSKALLMTMDQRHLLYRSAVRDYLNPKNSGCMMVFGRGVQAGLQYLGYARRVLNDSSVVLDECNILMKMLNLCSETTTVISSSELLSNLEIGSNRIAADPRLVCSAPFAALEKEWPGVGDYMLLVYDSKSVSAVAFRPMRT